LESRSTSRTPSTLADAFLYALFFLSGSAALIYQVAWVRSLSLVFGGSHLAVTTVLLVFMGGLAVGGIFLGARADRSRHPLRLYAALEIGIALSAASFQFFLHWYPAVYVPLARLAETSPLWLFVVRVTLASAGMLIPTTLIGGTLPVLTRFVDGRADGRHGHLARLYALNTLGAVAGTLIAGFLLLPRFGVNRVVLMAVAINLLIGAVVWLMPERVFGEVSRGEAPPAASIPFDGIRPLSVRLVLFGIGVSGFCALGYEVLWTRVLTLVVGTSTYSFTILLAALLTGIAAGGQFESILGRIARRSAAGWRPWVALFAATQILIGLSALAVTWAMRDLPLHAVRLQDAFRPGSGGFRAQQVAVFVLAFAFLAVPAFFMGLAFPVAGNVHAAGRREIGRAVGEVLTFNTLGAILGAAVSGFVLVYLFGIERSLHLLVVANLSIGCIVLASLLGTRARKPAIAALAVAALLTVAALALYPDWGRAWDRRFLAVFRNNQYQAFNTPERILDALANTDVLYFFEGANETISVIQPRGARQAFTVNGRVEASTTPQDRQCQLTLGHLPMLAHPNPAKVFVVGTGTGMTLGATTIHPEVEEIVLAEIEPGVLPATRTFAGWNHRALDNPKVHVVFNDGRNYLRTTRESFDVITADPIHPWSGGASYLYTDEYFRLASGRLNPGGVMCQWLPIYELNVDDLRSVVRTFSGNFAHTMLWLTHYDAEILGSNDPIVLDPGMIGRRIARSPIREDLDEVFMGSSSDFLAYFVAGTEALREFSRDGVLNTDDNLWLEFHSPISRMLDRLEGDNVVALTRHRESLHGEDLEPARLYDTAHALFLWGRAGSAEFARAFDALKQRFPWYAPGRFLAREVEERNARQPVLRGETPVQVRGAAGATATVTVVLSVVTLVIGPERGVVMVVDNEAREIYGQRYLDAPAGGLDAILEARARSLLAGIRQDAGPRTLPEWRQRCEALLR
jgi:spermidine synthase